MTGLLICAAVVAQMGWTIATLAHQLDGDLAARSVAAVSLALIAVALWLAYAAGGA